MLNLTPRLSCSSVVLACFLLSSAFASTDEPVSFYNDIRPIFQANCHGCHQPAKASGQLDMVTAERLRRGGESEQAAIVPGKPEESYLLQQIMSEDGEAAMPPQGAPLKKEQVAIIRRWIEQGAIDDSPVGTMHRYDVENPPPYTRPPVVTSLDYSADGKLLAVAGYYEVLIHSVDGESNALVGRLMGMSERIESLEFSPDGQRIAVTGGSPGRMGEVQIWDVASRQLQISLPVTFDTVYGVSWSPDGKLVAFGCSDSTVRAIDSETGEQVLFQSAHNDWVLDTVFSADGSHLATVGRDASAKLIEVSTQRFVDNITSITPGALRGGIHAVARHPMRDEILFGGSDGVPKIYRMHRITPRKIGDDANQLWELPSLPGRVFSVDYSLDGKLIAAGSSLDRSGAVHIYGIEAEPVLPEEIKAILIKPTQSRTQPERDQLKKHFVDGIQTLAKLSFDTGGIYAVSISPDNRHVAASGTDGIVRVIDSQSGEVTHQFSAIETTVPASESAIVSAPSDSDSAEPSVLNVNETMPDGAKVVRLAVQPDEIHLRSRTDYVQILATAELDNGSVIDVTRLAEFDVESDSVHVTATGHVSAHSDGPTTIHVKLGEHHAEISVDSQGVLEPLTVDFVKDVSPILARAGCNAGTCHGSKDGKNGFKLSLRGYDPLIDVRSLTDDLASRRTNLASAEQSLLLLKSTGTVPHVGGMVVSTGSNYYRTLLAWIRSGATLDSDSPQVARIDVQPTNPVVQSIGSLQQTRVVATYTDGSTRDVTREAFVESGDTEIAKPVPDRPGLIEVVRRGEAPVLVRYEGAYAATTITVMGDRTGFIWKDAPSNNHIDKLVADKLKRTKTSTSPLCDDYSFIRRIYLDLTGLPPTVEQVRGFVEDKHDSRWKRDQLVDQLIGCPDYVEHWTNKWADLLQVNGKFLGREGAEAFRNWIRGEIDSNTPYDEFARQLLTANGSNRENPAASYFKVLRDPEATMENTSHLFLATRFNCNKCHDHPFERWTQDQYYQLSAYFARVGFKKDPDGGDKMIGGTAVESAKPMYEVVFTKPDGEVTHLRTGKVAPPKFPFECDYQCANDASRRERLAAWITSPDNPYFAKSYANRIWAYLTGRGLIDPIDDIRAGNPPTNPELLDWLTDQFVESGFNTRHLVRMVCQSRTYQLSLKTNRFNEDDKINYSHAMARRLPAEVLLDSIFAATGSQSKFPGVAEGLRAAALPDVGIKLPDGFLNNLGRPARESACECERSNDLQMGAVMALVNGTTVGDAVNQPENAIAGLVEQIPDDRELVDAMFLRILSRPATSEEIDDTLGVVDAIDYEHKQTLLDLENYRSELPSILEQREKTRLAELMSNKKLLASHQEKIAPERNRLEQERRDRIQKAEQALEQLRASLLAELPNWETSRSSDTIWHVLNPLEVQSKKKAEFRVLDDGSLLVAGKRDRDTYLVEAPTDLTGITGLRLEALTDESLPKKGPGRADDGNVVLTELKLFAAAQPSHPRPLFHAWDFSGGTDGWIGVNGTTLIDHEGRMKVTPHEGTCRFDRHVTLPATDFAIDVTASLDSATEFILQWQTEKEPEFHETRQVARRLRPGVDTWRTYRLFFQPDATVTRLRIILTSEQEEVVIDSIRLVQAKRSEFMEVKLQNAQADFSQDNLPVKNAIDGKIDNGGWALAPQMGKDHVAIFETADSYDASGSGTLRTELIHEFSTTQHSLGRFRISVTRSARPIGFGLPNGIAEILAMAGERRTEEQKSKLVDYYLSIQDSHQEQTASVARAKKTVPADPDEVRLKRRVVELEKPLPKDAKLIRLERDAELSQKQLENKRLTAAQDIAWALINSPEFLFNH